MNTVAMENAMELRRHANELKHAAESLARVAGAYAGFLSAEEFGGRQGAKVALDGWMKVVDDLAERCVMDRNRIERSAHGTTRVRV